MKKILTLLLAGILLVLSACGDKDSSNDSEGYTEGFLGDTLSTYWFDFTVEDAYACQDFGGYTAAAGKQLVVASPLSAATEQQLPDEYSLAIKEDRTGLLVYEVPADVQDFTMAFVEYFEDGTDDGEEGDAYFVYFTAKTNERAGI